MMGGGASYLLTDNLIMLYLLSSTDQTKASLFMTEHKVFNPFIAMLFSVLNYRSDLPAHTSSFPQVSSPQLPVRALSFSENIQMYAS